jgi:ABC-type branched-subunit amino acid transport system permease subunit
VHREAAAAVEKAVTPPPAIKPARMVAMKGATTLIGSIIGVLLRVLANK